MAVLVVLLAGGCGSSRSTYDVTGLEVTRYRYLVDPRNPTVHVMAEVRNNGHTTIREAMVVATGIGRNGERLGRNGEQRGEGRSKAKDIRPGETKQVTASFTNRARLAAIEVKVEPVPDAQRGR
jgi:hypothetical protein